MNKINLFLTNFILSAVRFAFLLIAALIFVIVGTIWPGVARHIGLVILVIYLLVCLISAINMQRLLNYRSDDDSEFNEMMDSILKNPEAFVSEIMETQEANKKLHGEELLNLSDEDLFETVSLQNLDIAEDAEEDREVEQFTGARRVVYVLGLLDAEVQNGGLCQFFVNSSRMVAPYVSESLETVGADLHREIFDKFIRDNNIDVSDLDSFKTSTKRGYIKQTKRYDFETFDDRYYELPALQDKILAYIRENIKEF